MRKCELSKLIAELGRLTPLQRRQVAIELNAGESKATAVALIDKGVADDPQCPHCDSKTVVRNGTADRLQRFKCRDCAKTFNAIIGTPLARLRMKDKWVAQAEALRDGRTRRTDSRGGYPLQVTFFCFAKKKVTKDNEVAVQAHMRSMLCRN